MRLRSRYGRLLRAAKCSVAYLQPNAEWELIAGQLPPPVSSATNRRLRWRQISRSQYREAWACAQTSIWSADGLFTTRWVESVPEKIPRQDSRKRYWISRPS